MFARAGLPDDDGPVLVVLLDVPPPQAARTTSSITNVAMSLKIRCILFSFFSSLCSNLPLAGERFSASFLLSWQVIMPPFIVRCWQEYRPPAPENSVPGPASFPILRGLLEPGASRRLQRRAHPTSSHSRVRPRSDRSECR